MLRRFKCVQVPSPLYVEYVIVILTIVSPHMVIKSWIKLGKRDIFLILWY